MKRAGRAVLGLVVTFALVAGPAQAAGKAPKRTTPGVGTWFGELGLGLVGMAVGGVGAGYVAYRATGGSDGGDGVGGALSAIFFILPAALAGGVYGTAAGVTTAGAGFAEPKHFWEASKGAWFGVLAMVTVNLAASGTMDQNSPAYQAVSLGTLLTLPLVATIDHNLSWGATVKVKDSAGKQEMRPMLQVSTDF